MAGILVNRPVIKAKVISFEAYLNRRNFQFSKVTLYFKARKDISVVKDLM
jgi:hypothetical protein